MQGGVSGQGHIRAEVLSMLGVLGCCVNHEGYAVQSYTCVTCLYVCLSGRKPVDVPRSLCSKQGNSTVTGPMAEDWLSCVPSAGLGRILPAVTKRTIGHWNILAQGL